MLKFAVYENDKTACRQAHPWNVSWHDTFEDALNYTKKWLGEYKDTIPENWYGSKYEN